MTPDVGDVSVTLHLGPRSRHLPLIALAAALRLPREPLRHTLTGLVLALPDDEWVPLPTPFLGEPTEGSERSSIGTVGSVGEEEKTFGPVDRSTIGGEPVKREEEPSARFLAELFDDLPNLPALEHLVASTPTSVVTAALNETLAVPAERIRRTRAAYFTAAVRRRLSFGRTPADS